MASAPPEHLVAQHREQSFRAARDANQRYYEYNDNEDGGGEGHEVHAEIVPMATIVHPEESPAAAWPLESHNDIHAASVPTAQAADANEDDQEPASWTSPPPMHELLAVDRSRNVRGGGNSDATKTGNESASASAGADADEPLQSIYAPVAMRKLRAHFGIAEDFFCESLFEHELKMRSDTGGRSDSLFFFSADRHFVVKTVPKAEMILLRRMLPDYFAHMMENMDSLLPRFLALFKVRPWPDKDPVHCVVMTNVLDSSLEVNKVFDLKGSTANRFVSMDRQRDEMEKRGKLPTLKDLNWKDPVHISSESLRTSLFAQIMADTQLLVRYDVMDYSLLIGVHTQAAGEDGEGQFPLRRTRWQTYHGGLPTADAVYFIGIIDILQEYDVYKQAERFVKTSILSPLSGYLQKSRGVGDDQQVPCPYCKFKYNKLPSAPSSDGEDSRARVVMVSCAGCGASFDYAEEGIATSDTNISSIEPADYRRRLLEFAETKVFVSS
ncbi:Phosphatidylinositol-4-phosphate 5-kinase, putative [Hondaea fermentalgiana]|uniref:Phosphatidylinositol-4-phosphate 5-kinase, putative n=1 Tax=Hondaea fermentalgiana TaxID=2315210 RepID=A0A2R5GG72_9STRA|nr:Phosphatidylinositol-4-phosphate 5-kinase, putative [Hondaea fermentalgiana]|eukprot:GBG28768.1 Phosphatidylinositol-4-phosphate 5-kinase, putative [Hondaea fermentalgiana]